MAWKPDVIETPMLAWYDATKEAQGELSQLTDQSGKGRHFTQSDPGVRPEIVDYDGKNWISFSDGDNLIADDFLTPRDFTICLIWESDSEGGRILDTRGTDGTKGWPSAGFQIKTNRVPGDVCTFSDGTHWSTVADYGDLLGRRVVSLSKSGGQPMIYRDQGAPVAIITVDLENDPETKDFVRGWGGLAAWYASSTLPNNLEVARVLSMGKDVSGGSPQAFIGKIGEILIFDGRLSTSDIEKAEGYLAHKWGTESQLPIDHTFYADPPGEDDGVGVTTKISGIVQIDGTPVKRKVRAFGYNPTTHNLDGESVSQSKSLGDDTSDPATGEYSIKLIGGYQDDVFVVAFDDYGQPFTPSLEVTAGDRVHPSAPDGYVYQCEGSGTLPETEPDWVADTETSKQYGTASMIAVPFYRPMVHGPVTPEVVDDGTSGSG